VREGAREADNAGIVASREDAAAIMAVDIKATPEHVSERTWCA
jgi:hypothetical protein